MSGVLVVKNDDSAVTADALKVIADVYDVHDSSFDLVQGLSIDEHAYVNFESAAVRGNDGRA